MTYDEFLIELAKTKGEWELTFGGPASGSIRLRSHSRLNRIDLPAGPRCPGQIILGRRIDWGTRWEAEVAEAADGMPGRVRQDLFEACGLVPPPNVIAETEV